MLIRSPAGKTVLIDAGNVGAGSAVNAYLDRLGVEGIDLAIVTHPHLDHMGGMVEVLEKHPPKTYMDPGYPHPTAQYQALLDWLDANQVPVRMARAGRTITLEPGLTLELFAPEEPLLSGTRSDANSNSIVAKLVYDTVSFLLTGDAEDVTEQRLMRDPDRLVSTVLKVAHHGGRHSTSDEWLARVQPTWAVISAGARNRYKHPTKETLGRLEKRGIHVFRTDRDGDVIARTDGKKIDWETTGEASAKLDETGGRSTFRVPNGGSQGVESRTGSGASKSLVDVNTANVAELTTLPGLGEATALKIIDNREEFGPFPDLDALVRIRGIGKRTVAKLVGHAEARPFAKPSHPEPVSDPPKVDTSPSAAHAIQSTTMPRQRNRLLPDPPAPKSVDAHLLNEVGRRVRTSGSGNNSQADMN